MNTDNTFSKRIESQFDVRSGNFDVSASWIKDKSLIKGHIDLAGKPCGKALDLCCGTGNIGRSLINSGWDVIGLDISESMVKMSSNFFSVFRGKASYMPFKANQCHLVVCRQSFQFLDMKKVLSEIKRVLKPEGVFVLSLTIPFSDADAAWLKKIHQVKQSLLLEFYTYDSLLERLNSYGFTVKATRTLVVRESISRWMQYAPELAQEVKNEVCSLVENAPLEYKNLHNVELYDGEIFENWNWIVIKGHF